MKQILLILLTIFFLTGCEIQPKKLVNAVLYQDSTLPVLEDIVSLDEKKIQLVFSEPVKVTSFVSPDNKVRDVIEAENKVTFIFENILPINREIPLTLCTKDKGENALSLTIGITGRNPDIPRIVINEFLAKGTDTQPNRIEFECQSYGNLAGLYLTDNIKGLGTQSYEFPNIEVRKGQYIVLYTDSKPSSDVINDLVSNNTIVLVADLNISFPSNNGICILYDTKLGKGKILDCIVYTSNTASTYSGFGKKDLESGFKALQDKGDWVGDPINAEKCTSTRTICRYMGKGEDTNSAFDFYIADTRKSSFGRPNTNEEYLEAK